MTGSRRWLACGLAVLACATPALAQTFHGGLRGAVREAGGVVPGVTVTLTNEATSVSRRIGRDEAVSEVIAMLSRLEEDERQIVVYRGLEERSFAEIAAILDCDEGTARVRFHRAKTLLRQHLRAGANDRGLR